MSAPPPRVAALFVNYNSGEYVANAVSSLLAQRVGGKPADVELVVVDNASPERESDRPHLEKVRREHGATLLWSDRNEGYSGGMARALAASRAPIVAAINPDVLFAESALERLLECLLSSPQVGMVGPCGYLDRDRLVYLPINALPTLDDEIARFRGRFSAEASLAYSIPRARETHRVNRAREPIDVGMLSGACMLLRRETVDRIGFFDPIYPLFYEDGDLCRRVHGAGLRVVHVPGAPITHFVSRSVVTAPKSDDPMKRWATARRRYFRRWYGPLGEAFVDRLDREMPKRHRFSGKPATPCVDL
ncbi:MAG TPA: glycosyltransferase family 2 protein, partial [Planctomycetota bacterium]|nr:glycosyltransferase family 2 protein [Planctomycetota bacterium]